MTMENKSRAMPPPFKRQVDWVAYRTAKNDRQADLIFWPPMSNLVEPGITEFDCVNRPTHHYTCHPHAPGVRMSFGDVVACLTDEVIA